MLALSNALYRKMAVHAPLTDLLSVFRGGPAIFTGRPIPNDASRPLVICAETVSDENRDVVNGQGREIMRDIAIYGKVETHFDTVSNAAELIRTLFHRQALAVAGFRVVNVVASGPISAPADEGEVGRIVTLTVRLDKLKV